MLIASDARPRRWSDLGSLGYAMLAALAVDLIDAEACSMRADAFSDRLADSPAWGAYFREVGQHFDNGAARSRRHPVGACS